MDDDWDTFGAPPAAPAGDAPAPASDDPFGGDALDGLGAPPPAANTGGDGLFDDVEATPAPPAAQEEEAEEVDMGMFDAPAPAQAVPMDDPMGDMGMGDPMGMGGSPMGEATPMDSAPAVPPEEEEDNSALLAWEEQHYQEIKQRREESAKKKEQQMKEATDQLNDFDEKRKKLIETSKSDNKKAETGFIAERDNALKAGLSGKDSWEKVSSYLDLTSDPKRNNTVARMKSVLIAVKSTPPATVKNFGAA